LVEIPMPPGARAYVESGFAPVGEWRRVQEIMRRALAGVIVD
jgi:hypothetical protein